MKRSLVMILTIWLCLACFACASQTALQQDWTPERKATWMLNLYNRQYDDYMIMAKLPNLSEEQKEMLRVKKQILVEVYPFISAYIGYVNNGQVPTDALEMQIMQLLNRLGGL